MKMLAGFTALLFCFPNLAAQQVAAPTPRDPQALAVLSQMLSVTGWGSVQPQDVVATGIVTRFHGDSQDAVAIKLESLGPRMYRSDVQDQTGTITTTLNGDGASVVSSSSSRLLPSYVAIPMRSTAFPFFAGFLSFTDPSSTVTYDGIETIAGQASYRIDLAFQPAGSDSVSLMRAKASQITIWISVATALPVQIEYSRTSNENPNSSRRITQTFSDYRTVGGIQMPFHQEEFGGGRTIFTLQLSAVNLNTGVASTDFALPTIQD
jgi:hypothetical protein